MAGVCWNSAKKVQYITSAYGTHGRRTRSEEGWLAMVNGLDPARRRSCGGEKGKTLRRGWDREVGEAMSLANARLMGAELRWCE